MIQKLTSFSTAGTAGLALTRVVADTVAVDVPGPEDIGAVGTMAETCSRREGLVLTDLQLARHKMIQITSKSAGGEEDKADGMHFA